MWWAEWWAGPVIRGEDMALRAKQIEHASPGMHADGNGLYLRVHASGAKGWVFRYQLNGKRREMGLGAYPAIDATTARAKAGEMKLLVAQKIDPIDRRQQENANRLAAEQSGHSVTFAHVAAEYIDAQRPGWKNAKHAAQWATTLEQYAYPVIGSRSVTDISTNDVLAILKPIWAEKTETASRVRNRVELVLTYAKAKKLRQGENPAAWRGNLAALLPKPSKVKKVRHHPALHHARVPEFLCALRSAQGAGARALELAILTATRSQEVRYARWQDFDLSAAVWTIPARYMKAEKEHRVPLSPVTVAYVKSLRRVEKCDLLFPGARKLTPISDMTLTQAIRRMDNSIDGGWWVARCPWRCRHRSRLPLILPRLGR